MKKVLFWVLRVLGKTIAFPLYLLSSILLIIGTIILTPAMILDEPREMTKVLKSFPDIIKKK